MGSDSTVPLGEVVDEYAVKFEATDYDGLGPLITTTVAALTGQPPEQVGTELTALVDVDALNRLFAPAGAADGEGEKGSLAGGDDQLRLSVAGCRVTVDPDGTVTVIPADRAD